MKVREVAPSWSIAAEAGPDQYALECIEIRFGRSQQGHQAPLVVGDERRPGGVVQPGSKGCQRGARRLRRWAVAMIVLVITAAFLMAPVGPARSRVHPALTQTAAVPSSGG